MSVNSLKLFFRSGLELGLLVVCTSSEKLLG